MKLILLLAGILCALHPYAQENPNWQNKDLEKDSVFGISTEKTYAELLKGKKPKRVLVAVIDSGVDTAHEDLIPVIWKNPKEKYDGRDENHNGYTDDVHGWNFIGGPTGSVKYDNLEITRLIRREKPYYDSLEKAGKQMNLQPGYEEYHRMQTAFDQDLKQASDEYENYSKLILRLDSLTNKLGNSNPSKEEVQQYIPQNDSEKKTKETVLRKLNQYVDFKSYYQRVLEIKEYWGTSVLYEMNLDFDPRSIVGDDYSNAYERYYGNSDVTGPGAEHATHVSGIIGGVRNNGLGADGIANNVIIMSVRTVPAEGDERDKDVANAIRYAADNGVRVINMSFGKPYSPNKAVVDSAVQYAMKKDVLIIHAAGNESQDLDSNSNFPNRIYSAGGEAKAWIEVGASNQKNDSMLVASFSNYGHNTVDVFAPGVQIYSSIPGNKYAFFSGTSMASPVVAGLATLIREYYPKLKAWQVKDIIMKSVVKVNHNIIVKSNQGQRVSLPFSSICISGGIVNAYQAFKLAAHYKS